MDAVSLRLLARFANATKQFQTTHTQILSTLLSLENLEKQRRACVASCSLVSDESMLDLAAPLLLKCLAQKMHVLTARTRSDQRQSLESAVSALSLLAKDALSALNRDHRVTAWLASRRDQPSDTRHPVLLDTVSAISSLVQMYEREGALLGFLLDEVVVDSIEGEEENLDEAQVHLSHVIARFRSLHEVDLVLEGEVLEIARVAASTQ